MIPNLESVPVSPAHALPTMRVAVRRSIPRPMDRSVAALVASSSFFPASPKVVSRRMVSRAASSEKVVTFCICFAKSIRLAEYSLL